MLQPKRVKYRKQFRGTAEIKLLTDSTVLSLLNLLGLQTDRLRRRVLQ